MPGYLSYIWFRERASDSEIKPGGINPCRIQMKEAREISLWVLFDYSKYAQNFGMAKCGRPLELVTMETTQASIDYV
ncbi:hypothetical protein TNCT_223201 [Trichonephila clavata]|uniref:Uncharacterized protein n=1 Tax=Trichonephila clavata TaxID=2740835 RepID=A0A8X6L7P0_TRICU|nr:hypothetical protein TNCT_223201 [Trichonephila clavata]